TLEPVLAWIDHCIFFSLHEAFSFPVPQVSSLPEYEVIPRAWKEWDRSPRPSSSIPHKTLQPPGVCRSIALRLPSLLLRLYSGYPARGGRSPKLQVRVFRLP